MSAEVKIDRISAQSWQRNMIVALVDVIEDKAEMEVTAEPIGARVLFRLQQSVKMNSRIPKTT